MKNLEKNRTVYIKEESKDEECCRVHSKERMIEGTCCRQNNKKSTKDMTKSCGCLE